MQQCTGGLHSRCSQPRTESGRWGSVRTWTVGECVRRCAEGSATMNWRPTWPVQPATYRRPNVGICVSMECKAGALRSRLAYFWWPADSPTSERICMFECPRDSGSDTVSSTVVFCLVPRALRAIQTRNEDRMQLQTISCAQ